ncbi:MAG: DNA invertase Pin-like site-specific DNA recombinase [Enterobacterales bacterium]|jgi:DNA invertase Pin-like site-specific DNA recombinase
MNYVMYRRVSTAEQASSGLGLAAQQHSINSFLNSSDTFVVGDYTDIQSGRKDNRENLQKALRSCRVNGATLVVSKLCRLSRSFAYSAKLLEGDVPVVITENPNASMLELRLKAAINQEERERISSRTREALAAKKLAGDELGNKDVYKYAANQDTTNANAARTAKATDYKQHMLDVITDKYGDDLPSLSVIADWLNTNNYETPRKSQFTRAAVQRIISSSK